MSVQSNARSAGGPGLGRVLFASLATLLVITAATWGPGPERFGGLYESEEALFEAVLGALEREDRGTLESLALSKTEY